MSLNIQQFGRVALRTCNECTTGLLDALFASNSRPAWLKKHEDGCYTTEASPEYLAWHKENVKPQKCFVIDDEDDFGKYEALCICVNHLKQLVEKVDAEPLVE